MSSLLCFIDTHVTVEPVGAWRQSLQQLSQLRGKKRCNQPQWPESYGHRPCSATRLGEDFQPVGRVVSQDRRLSSSSSSAKDSTSQWPAYIVATDPPADRVRREVLPSSHGRAGMAAVPPQRPILGKKFNQPIYSVSWPAPGIIVFGDIPTSRLRGWLYYCLPPSVQQLISLA